jgi:sugar/nucleoside kinase (ribokinase family)
MTSAIVTLLCFLLPLIPLSAQNVLTISDSIVDHILFVDENFIAKLPGKRGGCSLINAEEFETLLNQCGATPQLMPGGSGINVIKGLAALDHHCALIVQVGNDATGEFFVNSLTDRGIRLIMQTLSSPTGKSACLVTPNGERTMRTFLGASGSNAQLSLREDDFNDVDLLHLEGYQLKHHKLVKNAIQLAKQRGALISVDLASFEVVKAEKLFIESLLKEQAIDLLFANQDEAMALTGLSAREACADLASHCSVAIVTMGEKGCYVQQGEHAFHHPAFSVPTLDTTGAGDLFTSGFLHGFLHQWDTVDCAWMGSTLASEVVQVIGAEIPAKKWESIAQGVQKRQKK